MAVTEAYAGTHTVSTTEWSMVNNSSSIATNTTAGAYQVFVDVNALTSGDQFRVRVYEKVNSGTTQRAVFEEFVANIQGDPIWVSPTLMLLQGWDATLLKIAGSDESLIWSVRKAG